MTPSVTPDARLKLIYEMEEDRYLRSLPPEHFMEATAQATQRKITLESFDLIRVHRPDVQCFNELLVQYPRPGTDRPGQVVPDNMVVVHPEPIRADGSYNLPFQPVGPVLVLEYVSKYNKRKDYDRNIDLYQEFVRAPYYLLFYPDNQELTVFRLAGGRYVSVTPNEAVRLAIPELELEVALLDGWVRYWFRGELLPLPGDLLRQLTAIRSQLVVAEQEAEAERKARTAAERRAELAEQELARLREELARVRGAQP